MLTKYDGQSITYDTIGNPTSYYNGTRWTFTWKNGRQLATATDGTSSISYTYDANGLRHSKTVDGVVYTYYYEGSRLMRMTVGTSITMDFFYDQNGQPFAMKYNSTMLYYVLNAQGDVVRIVNASGGSYGVYKYDAWGNILYTTDNQYLNNNPLRYRGYVYDSESSLYYCQSRYYDPAIGRFLNADALVSTGQGLLGNNMFAYCGNNPVMGYDPFGMFTFTISTGYDMTFGFLGVSASLSIVVDDDWNIAIQASYSLPTYIDPETYHTGLVDAGLALTAQVTDDDTIYDLEGPGCYAGFSAGAGPSLGVDMVYSGVEALNDDQAQELPNGIAATVGVGVGIDYHFKQTNTYTLWSSNLKELLIQWIS